MAELNKKTVHALAAGLADKSFSAVEIAQDCLEAVKLGDDKIRAFLKVDAEDVLREAKASDERRAKGEALSEYDGIPIGIKDNIAVRNATVSCASKLLENVVSPYDATAVANVRTGNEALSTIQSRSNLDDFSLFGRCVVLKGRDICAKHIRQLCEAEAGNETILYILKESIHTSGRTCEQEVVVDRHIG